MSFRKCSGFGDGAAPNTHCRARIKGWGGFILRTRESCLLFLLFAFKQKYIQSDYRISHHAASVQRTKETHCSHFIFPEAHSAFCQPTSANHKSGAVSSEEAVGEIYLGDGFIWWQAAVNFLLWFNLQMSETFLQAVKSGQSSQDGETKVSVKEKEKLNEIKT